MDMTTITQLITSVGFPIAACVALYLQMNKQSEQHKEEMSKVTEALNNNTIALNKLAEKVGGLE